MKKINLDMIRVIVLLAAAKGMPGNAEDLAKINELSGSVYLGGEYTDNAFKQKFTKVDEFRGEIGGGIVVDGDYKVGKLKVDYEALRKSYFDNSQGDRTLLQGKSSLQSGSSQELLSLNVSHSRYRLLRDLQGREELQNSDERNITSIAPAVNLNFNAINRVSIAALYQDVRYRFAEINDSDRVAINLGWGYRLSETDGLVFSAGASRVDLSFDQYDYQKVSARYDARLRRSNYQIGLGYNSVERENGTDFDSPLVNFEWNFEEGPNHLKARALYRITDTSLGNNNASLNSQTGIGDSSGQAVGLYKLSDAELSWASHRFCQTCSVGLNVGYNGKDFEISDLFDSEQIYARVQFGRSLTRSIDAEVSISHREYRFDNNSILTDYDLNGFGIKVTYAIFQDLKASAFGRIVKEESGPSRRDYKENIIGFRLNYLIN